MKLLISIFLCLILAFWSTKFKVNIKYLEKNQNSLKIKFNINIGIYVFGIIKIFGISFKEDGIHFLSFVFSYTNIKINKDSMKVLKEFSIKKIITYIKINLEDFYLDLKIGSEDVAIAVFSVCFISAFLSYFSGKHKKQINPKKYHYRIEPIYNKNSIEFDLSTKISITLVNLLKTILNSKKKIKKDIRNSKLEKIPIKI